MLSEKYLRVTWFFKSVLGAMMAISGRSPQFYLTLVGKHRSDGTSGSCSGSGPCPSLFSGYVFILREDLEEL